MEFVGAGMNYGVFAPYALPATGWWQVVGHVVPANNGTGAPAGGEYAVDLLAALNTLGRGGVERALGVARRRRNAHRLGATLTPLSVHASMPWDTPMVAANFSGRGDEGLEYFRTHPPTTTPSYRYASFRWEQHMYKAAYQATVPGTTVTSAQRHVAIANFLCLLVPDGRLRAVRMIFLQRQMRMPEWRESDAVSEAEKERWAKGEREEDGTLAGMYGKTEVVHDLTRHCERGD